MNSNSPQIREQQIRLYRWQRKAQALLQQQSEGKILNNQKQRLITRWQRFQAQTRAKGA